ncbi:hypothetical protein V6N11_028742 [Hibiscus sabdariffa]|uniref:Secreted protein n=1 Tax=Hibiscus sabdariffa TaxID=183260 RepID=A0ABR2PRB4_9ROSI
MYGLSLWVLFSARACEALHSSFLCCPGIVKTFIFTCSSFTLNASSPFSELIITRLVARKGLPRIIGACSSTSQSKIRKSAGKMNLSIRTRMSSIFPSGCTNERSASYSITVVGLASPMPRF